MEIMKTRSELMSSYPTGVASNGNAAVMVIELADSIGPSVYAYAPSSIGGWGRREEFNTLVDKAMSKIGWRRDRRCSTGWRKVQGCSNPTKGAKEQNRW